VGEPVLDGNAAEAARLTVASEGAPPSVSESVEGSPVVVEPDVKAMLIVYEAEHPRVTVRSDSETDTEKSKMCRPAVSDREPPPPVPVTLNVESPREPLAPAAVWTVKLTDPGRATEVGKLGGVVASAGKPIIDRARLEGAPADPGTRVAVAV